MERSEKPIFLLGLGAQKAGTSWLAEQLGKHPEFLISPIKEIHYWDRRFHPDFFGKFKLTGPPNEKYKVRPQKSMNRARFERYLMSQHEVYYKAFFEARLLPEHRAFGEFSPSYCILDNEQLNYIQTFMKPYRTKALFILRDPVSRLWSQCKMEAQKAHNRGKIVDPHRLFETKYQDPKFLRRGDYRTTVINIDTAFSSTDRLYLFFDDLFEDKAAQTICDFLNIGHMPFNATENPNEGAKIEAPTEQAQQVVRASYRPIYEFTKERFGSIPIRWKQR